MNLYSQCPECQEWVSLPERADPGAHARCPLCDGEFLVEDVLKNLPPELIILDEQAAIPSPFDPNSPGLEAAAWQAPILAESEPGHSVASPGAEEPSDFRQAEHSLPIPGSDAIRANTVSRRVLATGSSLRTMRNVALGGIVGLVLGYFILLWIAGPKADFLKLGAHLPKVLLPKSFDK